MTDEAIAMSLDDYIEQNMKRTGSGRGRGRGRGRDKGKQQDRNRGTPNSVPKATGGTAKKRTITVSVPNKPAIRRGGVSGARGGRSYQSTGSKFTNRSSRPVVNRRAALDGDAKWSHDMFDTADRAPPRRQPAPGPSSKPQQLQLGSKLLVSNLDVNVTEDDIQELFGSVGPLRKSGLHYDKSGKSLGSAEVLFENKADAYKAMQKFQNAALDGKKLMIEMVQASEDDVTIIKTLSSGMRVTAAGENGGGNRSGIVLPRSFQQATASVKAQSSPAVHQRGRLRSAVAAGGDDMEE